MSIVENQKYQIIYADPPWKYNSRANHKTKFRGGAEGHYPLMTMEQIKALPVPEIADNNCALFMWCTFPYLDEQIKLFKHWGFDYKTVGFDWVKTNPKNNTPFFGVGYYTKSNAEVCLLGIKGKIKPISNKVSSIVVDYDYKRDFETIQVISPRREHSRKPDIVKHKIVELFGDLPRIELFCRDKENGWGAWGNQVDTFQTENQLKLLEG